MYFWTPGNHHHLFAALGQHVEADASDVAEVLLEVRRLRVHVGEDEAVVALDLRGLDQAPVLAVELLVVDLFEAGDADEVALQVVGPAVVGAHEGAGVPFLGAADRVAPVAAAVDQHLGLHVVIADDDDAVLAHEGHEEVARVGDLATRGT